MTKKSPVSRTFARQATAKQMRKQQGNKIHIDKVVVRVQDATRNVSGLIRQLHLAKRQIRDYQKTVEDLRRRLTKMTLKAKKNALKHK